ncbi:MAG TPA: mercuric reductase [Aggregatilinea sp.]|uniref:mercuric reductase n=1 Tax=Aggregatilinea sp. TaxID=2806333 RepID=UPI002C45996F|nr:mercuric reductase [Aggregatilinea sp.]HML22492.1 mercuric reductase [Aggregatilinea sp.]
MALERFDAVIIGSGQGGTPLALAFARAGRTTALVERAAVGGTCVNTGCTPTKTLVGNADVVHTVRHSGEYGVHTGPVSVDMVAIRARKQQIVDRFRDGSLSQIENARNLELIRGEASFSGPKTLDVRLHEGGTRQITADVIVLDTGSRSRVPPIAGLDRVNYLDNTTVMELETLPPHLLIVGGGYIGVEFAQIFQRFGSDVTLVQHSDQLLTREDPDIAQEVAAILRDDGITVLLNAELTHVEPDGDGLRAVISAPDGERTVTASHLLLAVGRVPNTDTLNLPAAGVKMDDNGYIRVNDRLETSAPGINAIGDVKGGPAFTHISYDDYRVLRTNLLEGGQASIKGRMVPYVVFMDPQLARIGLSEQDASRLDCRCQVATLSMNRVARAIETGNTRGVMKAVVDAETQEILGFTILGMDGGELMSLVQVAMMGKLPYTALRDGIFAHPTLAEAVNNLFLKLSDVERVAPATRQAVG